MRLKNYLSEQFYDAMIRGGTAYEIFVNPSKKEMKEVMSVSGRGYRWLVDFKNKKFYIWSDELFHEYAMEFMRNQGNTAIPEFNAYWKAGKDNDHILTGSYDAAYQKFDTDHKWFITTKGYNLKLEQQDWRWLKKYIDVQKLYDLVMSDMDEYMDTH